MFGWWVEPRGVCPCDVMAYGTLLVIWL